MVKTKITGLDKLSADIRKKLLTIADKDKVLRIVATTMCAEVRERIHEEGLNAGGAQIGTYDDKYLKVRQKKYGRTGSRKVIISLTRQLENDFSIGQTNPIKTANGWGLGFKNVFNADKSMWMEEKYGKIWSLTNTEKKQTQQIADGETNKILKK